jgi:hypothetical protein
MSTTMSGRKKMYNRWKVLTEQTRLMEKCKRLPLVFGQISSAIKSVADNALYVDR